MIKIWNSQVKSFFEDNKYFATKCGSHLKMENAVNPSSDLGHREFSKNICIALSGPFLIATRLHFQ